MVREFKEVLWNARNVLPLQDIPGEMNDGERFTIVPPNAICKPPRCVYQTSAIAHE